MCPFILPTTGPVYATSQTISIERRATVRLTLLLLYSIIACPASGAQIRHCERERLWKLRYHSHDYVFVAKPLCTSPSAPRATLDRRRVFPSDRHEVKTTVELGTEA